MPCVRRRYPRLLLIALLATMALLAVGATLADVAPQRPSNVHATQGEHVDRVVISWDEVPGAERYQVWRGLEDGGDERLLAEPLASPYSDSTVVPGVIYRYYVKACDGGACGPSSPTATGWAAAGDAYEPDNERATATDISSGEIQEHSIVPDDDVDWVTFTLTTTSSVAIDLQAYGMALSMTLYDDAGDPIRQASTTGMDATMETVMAFPCGEGGLAPGRYDLRIAADVAYLYHDYLVRVQAVDCAQVEPPAAPEGVVASDGGDPTCVMIYWQRTQDATRYQVYRATALHGPYAQIGAASATTFQDCDVTPSALYYYAVAACNDLACGALSRCDAGYAGTLGQAYDPYEPDDTFVMAQPIAPGVTQAHTLLPLGDVDWLTFDLTAPSGIELQVSHQEPVASEMVLYDSLGDEIGRASQVCGPILTLACDDQPLPAGRYSFCVYEATSTEIVTEYHVSLVVTPCRVQDPVAIWCIPMVSGR